MLPIWHNMSDMASSNQQHGARQPFTAASQRCLQSGAWVYGITSCYTATKACLICLARHLPQARQMTLDVRDNSSLELALLSFSPAVCESPVESFEVCFCASYVSLTHKDCGGLSASLFLLRTMSPGAHSSVETENCRGVLVRKSFRACRSTVSSCGSFLLFSYRTNNLALEGLRRQKGVR